MCDRGNLDINAERIKQLNHDRNVIELALSLIKDRRLKICKQYIKDLAAIDAELKVLTKV